MRSARTAGAHVPRAQARAVMAVVPNLRTEDVSNHLPSRLGQKIWAAVDALAKPTAPRRSCCKRASTSRTTPTSGSELASIRLQTLRQVRQKPWSSDPGSRVARDSTLNTLPPVPPGSLQALLGSRHGNAQQLARSSGFRPQRVLCQVTVAFQVEISPFASRRAEIGHTRVHTGRL